MSYGWHDRPTKVEVKNRIGGDKPARLISIGKYEITVPDDAEADVTYTIPGYRKNSEDPRDTFPNMTVADGEIRFPVEDLVPMMLSRLDPVDLATALWANDEVREQFVYAATQRYSESNIGDADRRSLITGLQEAIYSAALDNAVNKLTELEYRFGQQWYFWDQISQANQVIKNIYPDTDHRLACPDADPVFKVCGENWGAAREFWREELKDMFPATNARDTERGARQPVQENEA